jgi:CheY-like chemotaxis protein
MIFRRKNIKVVIVDDDPIFSSVLVKCLRKKGMNDIEVFDSAVPLLNRDNWSPDLIFMDFKMSDLNGARAARSIKRKKSSSVIILMSSSGRVERVKRHKFKIDRIAHKEIGVLRIAEAGSIIQTNVPSVHDLVSFVGFTKHCAISIPLSLVLIC